MGTIILMILVLIVFVMMILVNADREQIERKQAQIDADIKALQHQINVEKVARHIEQLKRMDDAEI